MAFSEPETRAVRKMVESEETIVAALNFHSDNTHWLHPYGYMKKYGQWPDNIRREYIHFYRDFGKKINEISSVKYGNAIETLGHTLDGSLNDWLLGQHNILSFSSGIAVEESGDGLVSKSVISKAVYDANEIVDLFLQHGVFRKENLSYSITNRNELIVEFRNKGLSTLYTPMVKLSSDNEKFIESIDSISSTHNSQVLQEFDLESTRRSRNSLTFNVNKINRFENFGLLFKLSNHSVLQSHTNLQIELFMADGTKVDEFDLQLHKGHHSFFILINSAILLFFIISILTFILSTKNSNKQTNGTVDSPLDIETNISQP